jgi:serine/threonine-protein kinase
MSIRSSQDNPQQTPSSVLLEAGLAGYEFVRSLGQAQRGELVLTRQRYRQGTGGYAVLKRLNRVVRQEDYQRLVEEARLGAKLRHPNLASVQLLVGSLAEPLLLLEYIEGEPLGDLMRQAEKAGLTFSEAFACYVTSEVAEGLQYVHSFHNDTGEHLGIVHRDVSPHTILLSRHGEVKLTDFGSAWSRIEGRISTEGDSDIGDLAYSSPERAVMETVDGRSDLFSLGLVLLQLLTGKHLLDAAARHEAELLSRQMRLRGELNADRDDLVELDPAHTGELMKRIRLLDDRQVEEATASLPEGLRSILHRMLARRPEDRYATGAELAQALRDYQWGQGHRFGRTELVAEVSAVREASLDVLDPGPSKRGKGSSRGRRKGPGRTP